MNIDLQSTMRYGDVDALEQFLGDHDIAHTVYQQAVFTQKGVQIPGFPMAQLGNANDWLQMHQMVHRALYATLGLGDSPDLASFDLSEEGQFYDFMYNHQQIHDIIDNALGLK